MNKLAHGGPYPGREADEAAIFALCKIQTAAALPHTRQQVLGVPPRAPPVTSHLLAVPAAAASAGVAPLVSTTQEVDVPPVAPLAPETQEEPVAALAVATEMEDVDLPDANLAEAIAESERRDTDPDAARAPRKRRAMTNDDSDTPSQTSDAARPRKKAPRASRTSTTESGTTIAGSSRSTAKQKPTKTTRRSTRPPAASRQPDEDGFVAPPRRHTARAAALQQPTPLPTANAFASASVDALDDGAAPPAPAQKKPFAAATKGGPSASTARPSAQAEGETQQPTAPSTASPVGVATPAPSQSARVAAPRRRRRRAGRATPAVAQRTAANTLPQQRTAPRAVPQPRSTADAPQQPSTSDRPQQAAPVVEAAPEAPTAPLAADAAELRSLLRSLSQLLEQLPLPLETPVDVPTAQQDIDEAFQHLVSLMPQAAAAPLGVDSDNDEEEMQTEQTSAGSQASTSRASRKRQKSDDDSSAPDARKFRKENALNGTKTGTKIRRRTLKSKVDNDGFVAPTKTAKATRQPTAAPVGTSNSFQALSDSEDEELTLPPLQQRRAPPPLIVKFERHFRELQNALNLLIGRDSYTISTSGDDLHKVKVKTTEHFVKLSEECTRRGWNFYTFSSNRKKPLKVVFRKIPRTLKPEEVKEDLEQMGYCVEEVIRMKLHRTKGRNPLFLQRRVSAGTSHPRGAPTHSQTKRRRGRRGRASGRPHSEAVVNLAQQRGNSDARNKERQQPHRQPQNAPPAMERDGGQTPPAASQQVQARLHAAPAAANQAAGPPSPPQRAAPLAAQPQVVPPPAPLPRQSAPTTAPRRNGADQSAPPVPDRSSMVDFPEPRWRRHRPITGQQPAPAAHTNGGQQRSGNRTTGDGHTVGPRQNGVHTDRHDVGPRQDGDRIDRLLDTMQLMMARVTELMAAVQQVLAIASSTAHHA
ncbi:PHD finger protein rhinoceros-like [Schistocerca cancellata]|uniref:PHD finger protein rhinoceros-like n=2 Tax=Schistocerca cancellata TaxID=274614 RepID=UPI0021197979|nr:PHD finger protein rhinoceros-like [Schistocerca cancellata]